MSLEANDVITVFTESNRSWGKLYRNLYGKRQYSDFENIVGPFFFQKMRKNSTIRIIKLSA